MACVSIRQRLLKNLPAVAGAVCTPRETGYKHPAREDSMGGSRSREYDN
jgi:hypothetical protein